MDSWFQLQEEVQRVVRLVEESLKGEVAARTFQFLEPYGHRRSKVRQPLQLAMRQMMMACTVELDMERLLVEM
jgi:hypothetical protein